MAFPHICLWGDSGPSLDEAKFRSNKKNRTFVLFFYTNYPKSLTEDFSDGKMNLKKSVTFLYENSTA
ncbi:hypothetical protein FH589_05730 [Leptospira interrogans]|uniref:hypothetical protein n=1 Tax=Leptospira interrogans TaxID=173 RepID=UPI0010C0BE6D|nr:hypothetical protein [Leptospira interrogans]KAA1268027.1 hypothetical protein C5473_08440 [Leptospira interrogans serovar Weerasinghe]QCO40151.1 hypothetical protein E4413_03805 [Leptospira interrogans]ULG78932.1 hypothetical protein FH595_08815 [Leptospira interrogans]ULG92479.1 hypothetical protein FH584_00565 [Leptospira interrogans]UML69658.1 hypothetical protein FH589_05730 [Leptospira interrogans]